MTWIADASAISTFRMSPESFRLRYRKHLRPPKTLQNAADAGSALHVALDVWFREPESQPEWAMEALRAAWGPESMLAEARPLALMERVLATYCKQYPREADPFRVVQNESYVEATITHGGENGTAQANGLRSMDNFPDSVGSTGCLHADSLVSKTEQVSSFRYCAIIDRGIEMPDGSRYTMDSKSTGTYLNAGYFKLMAQSDQLIGQVALERALGRRCDGFYVDAIHVSNRKSVANPEMVRYGPILVPDWRVDKWAADIAWTLHQIADLEAVRGLDKPWPVHHNWSFGKPDAFWEFVEQPPELHTALEAGFEVEAWNPEKVAAARQQMKLLAKIAR